MGLNTFDVSDMVGKNAVTNECSKSRWELHLYCLVVIDIFHRFSYLVGHVDSQE